MSSKGAIIITSTASCTYRLRKVWLTRSGVILGRRRAYNEGYLRFFLFFFWGGGGGGCIQEGDNNSFWE